LLDAERFLIVNGDTLTDCDLAAVARQHVEHRARVTMAVVEGDVDRYGGVLLDRDARVRGFGKADLDARARHFIGVQAVEASVFADLPDDEPSETVKTLYPRLLQSDRGCDPRVRKRCGVPRCRDRPRLLRHGGNHRGA
jgi:NDP-sugar pyrophosphorylase family protein